MADFFSNIFYKIKNIFKTKNLDESITNFQTKIDEIITDLILPYAQPTKLSSKDRFRDLITLLDAKKCNKIAVTLSSNLDKNYTKIQLEQFASSILVGKDSSDCKDDDCSDNANKTIDNSKDKVSKKQICNAVAIHYVKILNLIAAILTAVNPSDNICLNRLRNLLTVIGTDEKEGLSSICDANSNVVKGSILHEPGFRQLLMLYYYHLIQDSETDAEKENVRSQYENMVKTITNMVIFVDPKLKFQKNSVSKSKKNDFTKAMALNAAEEGEEEELQVNNEIKNINDNNNNDNDELSKSSSMKTKVVEGIATNMNSRFSNLKTNINSKLTNIKDEEKQNLDKIMSKIEGLGEIIEKIQNNKTKTSTIPNTMPNEIKNTKTNINVNTQNILKNNKNNSLTNNIPSTLNVESLSNNINVKPTSLNTTTPTLNTTPLSLNTTPPTLNTTSPSINTTSPTLNTTTPTLNTTPLSLNTTSPTLNTTPLTLNTTTPTLNTTPLSLNTTPSTINTKHDSVENKVNDLLAKYNVPKQAGGDKKNNKNNKNNNNNNNNNINNNINNNNNNINKENNNKPPKNNNNNENENENENDDNETNLEESTNSELQPEEAEEAEEAEETIQSSTKNNMNTLSNNELNQKIKELSNNAANNNLPNNNLPINNSLNNNALNNNLANTSKNPVIQKFIDFVNSYANIDTIDEKIIALVNTAFKTGDKFDINNPTEKDLRIKEDNMNDFCKKNVNNNSMIPITLSDPRLTEYIKIYKDMKNVYIDNCEYLLRILETKILDKTPVDEKDENPHFTIKNIGYSDLVSIETDVRNKLVTMYSGCHEKYQRGIVALFNALKPEEQE